jgi:hypothetical protein
VSTHQVPRLRSDGDEVFVGDTVSQGIDVLQVRQSRGTYCIAIVWLQLQALGSEIYWLFDQEQVHSRRCSCGCPRLA